MGKRQTPEQIKRLLGDADRDLAKGLTVSDVCRKHGVSQATSCGLFVSLSRLPPLFRPTASSGTLPGLCDPNAGNQPRGGCG